VSVVEQRVELPEVQYFSPSTRFIAFVQVLAVNNPNINGLEI
jgi:hypothetical protein